jgi:hypothetical protein
MRRDKGLSVKGKAGERLQVHPHCLMFFVDETGHEDLSDPNYPIFGLGGCAVMAGALDDALRKPWRAMKKRHFGGANVKLHAAHLRDPTTAQLAALADFFATQSFGRFAVTITAKTRLPYDVKPYELMPNVVRNRWTELASRCQPTPLEVALLHEASNRGDELVERYFGPSLVRVADHRIPVHHGFLNKGDEALEVADFIVQAAGRQAHRWAAGSRRLRKDFKAVFHANPLWSSFMSIDSAVLDRHQM